jgi:hypothetical protein
MPTPGLPSAKKESKDGGKRADILKPLSALIAVQDLDSRQQTHGGGVINAPDGDPWPECGRIIIFNTRRFRQSLHDWLPPATNLLPHLLVRTRLFG